MPKSFYKILALLFLFLSLFYSYLIKKSFYPPLPKKGEIARFYSNQMQNDLNFLFLHAINKAKKSIHLVVFGLSEGSILKALAKSRAKLNVYYDKRSSSAPENENFHPLKTPGLLHQKILVIDKKLVFLGSTNMTKTSLLMHSNLVIGFYSPEIAKFLMENTPFSSSEIISSAGGQKIEIYLLPNKNALERIKKIIKMAKDNIAISMFTFTNMELTDELIKARQRGVKISIAVDYNSAINTSALAIDKLKKEKIKIMVSQGIQLLHHKYLYVDNDILVSGSANWTKAAFKKNKDLIFIIHLKKKQKKFMNNLQKIIEKEALDL